MKLEVALNKLKSEKIIDVPFKVLFKDVSIDVVNKGRVGQLLELLLGLENGNNLLDFEDGELKTNKAKINGLPDETMFITQIASHVDELLSGLEFEKSWLYNKIKRMIYLPVVKIGEPTEWYFKHPILFEIENSPDFKEQLREDYYKIMDKMKEDIQKDGRIHTSSGKYIQIRTKDSKPYHPIFSDLYKKEISDKNYAFYFKKAFMTDLLKNSTNYPDID